MRLKNEKEDFDLEYTIGAYMALKKDLKTANLRKCLLQAASHEDYAALAQALCAFSGKRIPRPENAYPYIDSYMQENGVAAYDMFIDLITEVGESGFFKERLARQEVAELAESPSLEMDMEALTSEAMARFKGRLLDGMVEQAVNTTTTGVPTSTTLPSPHTAAE